MTLQLTYKGETSIPVEIEGFLPEKAQGKSLDEIRRREIFHGNRKVSLGEFFEVAGDPGDLNWVVEGNLAGVHWLGAHMSAGTIEVRGPAGRHVGSEMSGGRIDVHGDAGDWVGGEMLGGLIHIHGSAGHLIGAAYRGSRVGMRGGTILIDGNAGNEVGHTLRRGLIAVGGTSGDMVGFNMLAGTVVVLDDCGIRPGAGMRRGTLALLAEEPPTLLPTFRRACQIQPVAMSLLVATLDSLGFDAANEARSLPLEIYNGDFLDGGRGEILVRAA